jgi:putative hemolysin
VAVPKDVSPSVADRRAPAGVSPLPYPVHTGGLPDISIDSGAYTLGFARSPEELDEILRLRFAVFNLELGEGLNESFVTGRDEDELDRVFHHLLIRSGRSGEVVGTYRMQTRSMASRHGGFYSSGEFDLGGLPARVLDEGVEIGRACVSRDHRNGKVLHLLWQGLAAYLTWNRKRFLFGCCSLTSQDRTLGAQVYQGLRREGHVDTTEAVTPLPGLECSAPPGALAEPVDPVHIPPLFQSYLNLGAKVCGPPAIDRLFKTIDFLVLFDKTKLNARVYRRFFG